MTDSQNSAAPAGWYVDPITRRHLRWWNGLAWTESVAPLPGVEPAASVAPAPRVQQRFALQASDDETQAAAAHTQVQAERFTQPAQQFVTQVPDHVAQRIDPVAEQQPTLSVAPTIPWPAMQNGTQSAAAQPVGHYTPQYADALSVLGALPVDDSNDDEGVDDPAPAGSGFAPAAAAAAVPSVSAFPTEVTAPVSASDARSEAVKSAAARLEAEWAAQLADQAQRDSDAAHYALAAQAEAAHARAQTHTQAQAQAFAAAQQAQQAPGVSPPVVPLPTESELDESVESTLMSRRRLRDRSVGSAEAPSAAAAPSGRGSIATADDDIWAGPGDRRGDASWSPVGNGRVAELNNQVAHRWSTASVWLLTLTPWLWGLALFVTLSLFEAWSLPAVGVLALPWLVGLLFAQQDAARLRDFGHEHPPSASWALLTAPVYLVLRTIMLRRTLGTGSAPLIVWAINAALLSGIIAAATLMPEILPSYVVSALEPLKATANAWAGR